MQECFGRYAKAPVRLAAGTVEGRPALLVLAEGRERPLYFIFVEWDGDRVTFIRDYRYVEYIANDLEYSLA